MNVTDDLRPTGFCWKCGRACTGLFCNDRCLAAYTRTKAAQDNREIRRGKRAGYGPAGSTH